MKKENIVKLQCTVCKHINYYVHKNKKTVERKLEFKNIVLGAENTLFIRKGRNNF